MLRLEGGAEYYIPVFARYASEAFGTPLEQLSSKHGSQVLLRGQSCHAVAVVALASMHVFLGRFGFRSVRYLRGDILYFEVYY